MIIMSRISHLAIVGLFLAINSHISTASAQGSLNPSGPPGGTMKSLSDLDAKLEHRTPISAVPYIISTSGSYYLTTNVLGTINQYGITITANNVTLDLNGFSVIGVPGSRVGVFISAALTNETIANGTITQWGGNGLDAYSFAAVQNLLLENLTVSANGNFGIIAQGSSEIRNCLVQANVSNGMYILGGLISDCRVNANGDCGILVFSSTVADCHIAGNADAAILVDGPGCLIIRNDCFQNNLAGFNTGGIYVNDANNRIEENNVVASGHCGIQLNNFYTGNLFIKNSVSGNTNTLANNYLIGGNNIVGPLISQFGTITNYNPWANFSY
jgi:hypothetical protein